MPEKRPKLHPSFSEKHIPPATSAEDENTRDTHREAMKEDGPERRQVELARALAAAIAALLHQPLPGQVRGLVLRLRDRLQGKPERKHGLRALEDIRRGLDRLEAAIRRALKDGAEIREPEQEGDFAECDSIYVDNAGVVLLWPFYERFFTNVGLIAEQKFISPEAQQRAVLLLQFLVDGETETEEYLLPLNKLLCGYPLTAPLPLEFEPTETELAEVNALLNVVQTHNPLMKNLTPQGFRRAWLQRQGVLKGRDDRYVLHVAQQAYDIILEQLPWSLEQIRLRWMETMLATEWGNTNRS